MKHVLISDTHGDYTLLAGLPPADVLIHCGDATRFGSRGELREFAQTFSQVPSAVKILIAGNHDGCFQKHPEESRHIVREHEVIYLEDESVTIVGIKYYGMPWTLEFYDWSFMTDEAGMLDKLNNVPVDTDVLITHGPPKHILDLAVGEHAGSIALRTEVQWRIKPKLHVFGHIHEGYGTQQFGETMYVNCSLLDGYYQPVNLPIICELEV